MFVSESFFGGFNRQATPYDVFKQGKPDFTKLVDAPMGHKIRANHWLPWAAEQYDISKNLKDYVLVPTIALITNLPNTNGDCASLEQLLKFNPEHGRQAYETFIGKPTFYEHDNQNIRKAKGVMLDSHLKKLTKFGGGRYYKMVHLMAWDRNKDPLLVNKILTGEINAYSVGFYFKSYQCSICGKTVNQNSGLCEHTAPRKPTFMDGQGRLVYRRCNDIVGFEQSAVSNPAFSSNQSDIIINPQQFY